MEFSDDADHIAVTNILVAVNIHQDLPGAGDAAVTGGDFLYLQRENRFAETVQVAVFQLGRPRIMLRL